MIHPVNLPVFMGANSRYSSSSNNPNGPSLFGSAGEYYEREQGRPALVSPTTPGTFWSDVFKRSLITRINGSSGLNGENGDSDDHKTPESAFAFPESPQGKEERRPLELRWIDLHIKENAEAHHTSSFDLVEKERDGRLVVRRGLPVKVTLQFYRPLHAADDVSLSFELGPYPAESKGTRGTLSLKEGGGHAGWNVDKCEWDSEEPGRVTLHLRTPPSLPIGIWTLKVLSATQLPVRCLIHSADSSLFIPIDSEAVVESVSPIEGIYILFNPWSKEDDVYMEDAEDREEYICNDVGKIWRGTHAAVQPCVWSYGQFEEGVLEAVMLLLEKCRMPYALRASPVHISRAVSQIVNADDDRGVLAGNWSSDFVGGVPPTEWTGSPLILRQYASLRIPVKYAQCWVFAGVVTTVLRCLGIPARTVTNYSSAHDTDGSCTVDIHYSAETSKRIKELDRDSVWNFHVWNDCWMKRPDLPDGYGGWQAIDATPQEKSEGLYRAGPASHRAIKNGEISMGFDTSFLFAEVNADKCIWVVDMHKKFKLNKIVKNGVGRRILTKRPGRVIQDGNDDMMDITGQYKHYERTRAEREAVINALLTGHTRILDAYEALQINSDQDVDFRLELSASPKVGEDFTVSLIARNESTTDRTIKVVNRVNAAQYNGVAGRKIKYENEILQLGAGEEGRVSSMVRVSDYVDRLGEQSTCMVTSMGHVLETGQVFADSQDLLLAKPDLIIRLEDESKPVVSGELVSLSLQLQNPMPLTLSDCRFMLDGPGLLHSQEIILDKNVPARGIANVLIEFRPWRSGDCCLVVNFTSRQLKDVSGHLTIHVEPKSATV